MSDCQDISKHTSPVLSVISRINQSVITLAFQMCQSGSCSGSHALAGRISEERADRDRAYYHYRLLNNKKRSIHFRLHGKLFSEYTDVIRPINPRDNALINPRKRIPDILCKDCPKPRKNGKNARKRQSSQKKRPFFVRG